MDLWQHGDELVSACAGKSIAATQTVAKAPRDFDKQSIADRMAERIIHVLETVQIQKEDGQNTLFAAGMSQFKVESFFKQSPVRKSR